VFSNWFNCDTTSVAFRNGRQTGAGRLRPVQTWATYCSAAAILAAFVNWNFFFFFFGFEAGLTNETQPFGFLRLLQSEKTHGPTFPAGNPPWGASVFVFSTTNLPRRSVTIEHRNHALLEPVGGLAREWGTRFMYYDQPPRPRKGLCGKIHADLGSDSPKREHRCSVNFEGTFGLHV